MKTTMKSHGLKIRQAVAAMLFVVLPLLLSSCETEPIVPLDITLVPMDNFTISPKLKPENDAASQDTAKGDCRAVTYPIE